MKYLKRYNKFNFQTNCRICLTQSVAKMIALDAPLNGDLVPKPLVYEALELVMSEKVNFNEQYPQTLCAVCVELLKISYDLKIQYHQSQKKLKEELGEGEVDKEDGKHADLKKSEEDKALVEILVGSERFNIHDVFIVEEDDQGDEIFDGFLNNLGKTISASFVKKGYKKPKPVLEVPSLIIEKVGQDSKPTTEDDRNTPETRLQEFENAYDSQDEEQQTVISDDEAVIDDNDAHMINDDATIEAEIVNNEADIIDNDAKIVDNEAETVDNDVAIVDNYSAIIDNEASDDIFIDTPVSDEIVKKFVTSTENDKKALESAMGLKYKCPYCEKPMSSLKKVKLHTSRTCTKNNSNARCYVCGVSFELRRQLLTHLKQVHLVRIKKSQELKDADKHKCHVCDKVFRSNGSLFYHMSKHLGKRYGCDKCDKRFYTKSQAANHRQTHNREDTLVICPICGKGFHYQSGLFYHMKMHTNERNYQCSFCPRRFYTRNSLKRHELTHTGARPYACNYCDKKFRSLGEVKKHKLLHTGERPYQCKYCNLGFTQAHNLKVHLMTHPGSFQCMHCTKGFPEKEILSFREVPPLIWLKKDEDIYPSDSVQYPIEGVNEVTKKQDSRANVEIDVVWKCSECNFESTNEDILQQHQVIHTQDTTWLDDWINEQLSRAVENRKDQPTTYEKNKKCIVENMKNKNQHKKSLKHCEVIRKVSFRSSSKKINNTNKIINFFDTFDNDSMEHQQTTDVDPLEVTGKRVKAFQDEVKDGNHPRSSPTGKTRFRRKSKNNPEAKIRPYKCIVCSYITDNRKFFKRHLTKHKLVKLNINKRDVDVTKETIFRCKKCNFITQFISGLKTHLESHDKEVQTGIKPGNRCLPTKYVMKRNKDVELNSLFSCRHCNFSTKYETYFKSHIERHSPQVEFVSRNNQNYLIKEENTETEEISQEPEIYILPNSPDNLKSEAEELFNIETSSPEPEYMKVTKFDDDGMITQEQRKKGDVDVDDDSKFFASNSLDDGNVLRLQGIKENKKINDASELCKLPSTKRQTKELSIQVSNVNVFKCVFCFYVTKYQRPFDLHMKEHIFRCKFGDFVTGSQECLDRHMLKHKNSTEIVKHVIREQKELFTQEHCKNSEKSKKEVLLRKNPKYTVVRSLAALIATEHSYCLIVKHLLSPGDEENHSGTTAELSKLKETSVVNRGKMFKCHDCSFATNIKEYLELHLKKHNNSTEMLANKPISKTHSEKESCQKRLENYTDKDNLCPKNLLCLETGDHKAVLRNVKNCSSMKCLANNSGVQITNDIVSKVSESEAKIICSNHSKSTAIVSEVNKNDMQSGSTFDIQGNIKNIIPPNIFKCKFCYFGTKYKKYLDIHMANHRKPIEVDSSLIRKEQIEVFAAVPGKGAGSVVNKPIYTTNRDNEDHRTLQELQNTATTKKFQENAAVECKKQFKCYNCEFATNFAYYLEMHVEKHRDSPEILANKQVCKISEKYTCENPTESKELLSCCTDRDSFSTSNRQIYSEPPQCNSEVQLTSESEVEIINNDYSKSTTNLREYKIQACSQFEEQDNIKIADGMPPSIFNCKRCPFKSNYKEYLDLHMSKHKKPTDIENSVMKTKEHEVFTQEPSKERDAMANKPVYNTNQKKESCRNPQENDDAVNSTVQDTLGCRNKLHKNLPEIPANKPLPIVQFEKEGFQMDLESSGSTNIKISDSLISCTENLSCNAYKDMMCSKNQLHSEPYDKVVIFENVQNCTPTINCADNLDVEMISESESEYIDHPKSNVSLNEASKVQENSATEQDNNFKCHNCSFETNFNNYLELHMEKHKRLAEIPANQPIYIKQSEKEIFGKALECSSSTNVKILDSSVSCPETPSCYSDKDNPCSKKQLHPGPSVKENVESYTSLTNFSSTDVQTISESKTEYIDHYKNNASLNKVSKVQDNITDDIVCETLESEATNIYNGRSKNTAIVSELSKIDVQTCTQSGAQKNIKIALGTPADIFKCRFCHFESMNKEFVDIHMSKHKEQTEIEKSAMETEQTEVFTEEQQNGDRGYSDYKINSTEPFYGPTNKDSLCCRNLLYTETCDSTDRIIDNVENCTIPTNVLDDLDVQMVLESKTNETVKESKVTVGESQVKIISDAHTANAFDMNETSKFQKNLATDSGKMYKCHKCNFNTNIKYHLKLHMAKHKKSILKNIPICELERIKVYCEKMLGIKYPITHNYYFKGIVCNVRDSMVKNTDADRSKDTANEASVLQGNLAEDRSFSSDLHAPEYKESSKIENSITIEEQTGFSQEYNKNPEATVVNKTGNKLKCSQKNCSFTTSFNKHLELDLAERINLNLVRKDTSSIISKTVPGLLFKDQENIEDAYGIPVNFFVCKICGFGTKYKNDLDMHMCSARTEEQNVLAAETCDCQELIGLTWRNYSGKTGKPGNFNTIVSTVVDNSLDCKNKDELYPDNQQYPETSKHKAVFQDVEKSSSDTNFAKKSVVEMISELGTKKVVSNSHSKNTATTSKPREFQEDSSNDLSFEDQSTKKNEATTEEQNKLAAQTCDNNTNCQKHVDLSGQNYLSKTEEARNFNIIVENELLHRTECYGQDDEPDALVTELCNLQERRVSVALQNDPKQQDNNCKNNAPKNCNNDRASEVKISSDDHTANGFDINEKSKFQKNLATDSGKKYKCYSCDFNTNIKYYLELHMEKHKKSILINKPICNIKSKKENCEKMFGTKNAVIPKSDINGIVCNVGDLTVKNTDANRSKESANEASVLQENLAEDRRFNRGLHVPQYKESTKTENSISIKEQIGFSQEHNKNPKAMVISETSNKLKCSQKNCSFTTSFNEHLEQHLAEHINLNLIRKDTSSIISKIVPSLLFKNQENIAAQTCDNSTNCQKPADLTGQNYSGKTGKPANFNPIVENELLRHTECYSQDDKADALINELGKLQKRGVSIVLKKYLKHRDDDCKNNVPKNCNNDRASEVKISSDDHTANGLDINEKSKFQKHLATDSSKKYKCHNCEFNTNIKYYLELHMEKHKKSILTNKPICNIKSKKENCKRILGTKNVMIPKCDINGIVCNVGGLTVKNTDANRSKESANEASVLQENWAEDRRFNSGLHVPQYKESTKTENSISIKAQIGFSQEHNKNPEAMVISETSNKLKCSQKNCSFTTSFNEHLELHLAEHINLNLVQKDTSSIISKIVPILLFQEQEHIEAAYGIPINFFKCKICSFGTKYKNYLDMHMSKHVVSTVVDNPLNCKNKDVLYSDNQQYPETSKHKAIFQNVEKSSSDTNLARESAVEVISEFGTKKEVISKNNSKNSAKASKSRECQEDLPNDLSFEGHSTKQNNKTTEEQNELAAQTCDNNTNCPKHVDMTGQNCLSKTKEARNFNITVENELLHRTECYGQDDEPDALVTERGNLQERRVSVLQKDLKRRDNNCKNNAPKNDRESQVKISSDGHTATGFDINEKSKFQKHLATDSSKKYKCYNCEFNTNIKYYLELHMEKHKKSILTNKPICNIKSKKDNCEKMLGTKNAMIPKSDINGIVCNVGDLTVKNTDADRSKDTANEANELQVNLAKDRRFSSDLHVPDYRESTKVENSITIKEQIRFSQEHNKNPEAKVISETSNKFKCSKINCSFTTSFNEHLELHLAEHINLNLVQKDTSSIISKIVPSLLFKEQEHIEAAYGIPINFFKCKICGFGTKYKNDLDMHMSKHAVSTVVDNSLDCNKDELYPDNQQYPETSKHKAIFQDVEKSSSVSNFVRKSAVKVISEFGTKKEVISKNNSKNSAKASKSRKCQEDLPNDLSFQGHSTKQNNKTTEEQNELAAQTCDNNTYCQKHVDMTGQNYLSKTEARNFNIIVENELLHRTDCYDQHDEPDALVTELGNLQERGVSVVLQNDLKQRDNCKKNASKNCNVYEESQVKIISDDHTANGFDINEKSKFQKNLATDSSKKYKCYSCDFNTNIKYYLELHMEKHKKSILTNKPIGTKRDHINLNLVQKDTSSIISKIVPSLLFKEQKSIESAYGIPINFFKCKICGFGTKYKDDLDMHMSKHVVSTVVDNSLDPETSKHKAIFQDVEKSCSVTNFARDSDVEMISEFGINEKLISENHSKNTVMTSRSRECQEDLLNDFSFESQSTKISNATAEEQNEPAAQICDNNIKCLKHLDLTGQNSLGKTEQQRNFKTTVETESLPRTEFYGQDDVAHALINELGKLQERRVPVVLEKYLKEQDNDCKNNSSKNCYTYDTELKTFLCKYCNFKTKFGDYMVLHEEKHNSNRRWSDVRKPNRPYKCKECTFSTHFIVIFETHLKKHETFNLLFKKNHS